MFFCLSYSGHRAIGVNSMDGGSMEAPGWMIAFAVCL